jgi:H+/Cl- antiporter ClcA
LKKLKKDNNGSFVPLLVFFIVVIVIGLLCGIFGYIIDTVKNVKTLMDEKGYNDGMNNIMSKAWFFLPVIVFIVCVSWLLIRSQKQNFMGGVL